MKQVLDSIKAIKFYGWEESYFELLGLRRGEDVKATNRFRKLQIYNICLGRSSPVIATVVTFIVQTARGRELSSSLAFATMGVFQTLRAGLIFLPPTPASP